MTAVAGGAALGAAVVLAVVVAASMLRVARGPTTADRMVGLQLVSTALAALALLLLVAWDRPRLADLALVIAALGSVTVAVFYTVARVGSGEGPSA